MGIGTITPEVLPQALEEPRLMMYTGRLPHLTLIYLNLKDDKLPFFQDAAVRRALLIGLNRQWMIDNLIQGQGILADGPILPGTWAYYDSIERLNFDPTAALKALKEAGYTISAEGSTVRAKDGVSLSFELAHPDTPTHTAIAESVQRDWAKLGVEVTLKAVPYDQLVNDYLTPRTYQAALVDLDMARSPDPDPYPFWSQAQIQGGQNYAQWDDRKASEYLEQARVMTDIGERGKAYRNFQVRFTMEMPALPLFFPVYSYGVDEQVQRVRIGSFFDPSDRFNTLATWFLVAERPAEASVNVTATP
jgi:peptide/nickel transport system substrate-binding protein